jgi:hypothetical protein
MKSEIPKKLILFIPAKQTVGQANGFIRAGNLLTPV